MIGEIALVIATLMLVWATLRLAGEAQIARLSANVVLSPQIWRFNESVLATDMSNVGSATAEAIDLLFEWHDAEGHRVGDRREIHLPALSPGQAVPYHPDTALREIDKALNSIEAQAEAGLTLLSEWSWTDGRRDWLLRPRRTRKQLCVDMRSFRESVHGGPQVLEYDDVDRLLKGVREMYKDFETIRRMRDANSTIPGVPGQFPRSGHGDGADG